MSVVAVVAGAWSESGGESGTAQTALLRYRRRDVAVLLVYAVLENFGYRQWTLWWRVRGMWDAWFSQKGWEKFERKGFGEPPVAKEEIGA